jgi:hypothetical protein
MTTTTLFGSDEAQAARDLIGGTAIGELRNELLKQILVALTTALAAKAATNRKLDDFGTPDDNTDLNATISSHGLCPKLGGGTTNFLRADGTWAAPAGGGSLSDPSVAYIRTDGNDTTGDGSPSAPFLTWQKAYDEGFKNFDLGVGTFAGGEITQGESLLVLRGKGSGTIVTALELNGYGATIELYHCEVTQLWSAITDLPPSAQPGGTTVEFTVRGHAQIADLWAQSQAGGAGESEAAGGSGGNGGIINIEGHIKITGTLYSAGGAGGSDGGFGPGMSGAAGTINLRNGPDVQTPSDGTLNVIAAIVAGVFTAS